LRPGLDDPKHLAKVRALPCAIRGRRTTVEKWVGVYPHRELVTMEVQHVCDLSSRSQAHHTTRKAQRGADSTAAPLCPSAHDLLHRMGVKAFEAMWQIDLAAVAAELAR
jgi:hypothetical protein